MHEQTTIFQQVSKKIFSVCVAFLPSRPYRLPVHSGIFEPGANVT